jgi:hypothetical protein
MAYYIDAEHVSLDDLRSRIEETDLVPSRGALMDELAEKFFKLKKQGITTLASLRNELKTARRMELVSNLTGIDMQYLTLLRREIESYFPKPFPLTEFDWLPQTEIKNLERAGICDSAALYQATNKAEGRTEIVGSTGIDAALLEILIRLVDLTRIQWVSPTMARMLAEAGYDSASKVAASNAENLCDAIERVNEKDRFFKGKIGLRDIKRLVRSAI